MGQDAMLHEEWNSKRCVSELCKKWKKDKPNNSKHNLLFLLYNVNSLKSHIADMDVILTNYSPQICILTEIGNASIKKTPPSPIIILLLKREQTHSEELLYYVTVLLN